MSNRIHRWEENDINGLARFGVKEYHKQLFYSRGKFLTILSGISKGQKDWFKLNSNAHFRFRFLSRLKVFRAWNCGEISLLAILCWEILAPPPRRRTPPPPPPPWRGRGHKLRINIWLIRGYWRAPLQCHLPDSGEVIKDFPLKRMMKMKIFHRWIDQSVWV